MYQQPENVTKIILGACTLHNILRTRCPENTNNMLDREDKNHVLIPGAWRDQSATLDGINALHGNNSTKQAKAQRDYLRKYFVSDAGTVPWQDTFI